MKAGFVILASALIYISGLTFGVLLNSVGDTSTVHAAAPPQGTTVHGQVVALQSAGRMAGGSELALQLTDIVINGTAHPVMTDTYQVQGQGQGGRTARNVAAGRSTDGCPSSSTGNGADD